MTRPLRILVAALLERVGVGEADRSLLADLLVKNDLRGVFSHGSRQVATYARDIRDSRTRAKAPVSKVTPLPSICRLSFVIE